MIWWDSKDFNQEGFHSKSIGHSSSEIQNFSRIILVFGGCKINIGRKSPAAYIQPALFLLNIRYAHTFPLGAGEQN